MEMMTVQLFVALLPVHRLSALGEAQLTVTLLLTMILLLVLAIPHQLVDMQILHAPPVLTHPYNKLSEEAQASTMVTMSVFPFIIRPVTVLMMHTTMVEAPGINIESVLMLRSIPRLEIHFSQHSFVHHSLSVLRVPLVFLQISAHCLLKNKLFFNQKPQVRNF